MKTQTSIVLIALFSSCVCCSETNAVYSAETKCREECRLQYRKELGEMRKRFVAIKNIKENYGITNPTPEQVSKQIAFDEYHEEMRKLSPCAKRRSRIGKSTICDTNMFNNVSKYGIEGFRDTGGPYAPGMKNHGTTAAKLGEAYSFWAATSFGDGHAASTIWFRKINVDATGRIVSIGPAEISVKVNTDF